MLIFAFVFNIVPSSGIEYFPEVFYETKLEDRRLNFVTISQAAISAILILLRQDKSEMSNPMLMPVNKSPDGQTYIHL